MGRRDTHMEPYCRVPNLSSATHELCDLGQSI